jgi:hypothetical protein
MKLKPLAVAVGLTIPVIAYASTVTATATTVSPEYLATVGGVDAPSATLNLGAQYSSDDVITFRYSATPVASVGSTTAFSYPTTIALTVNTNDGGTTVAGTDGVLSFFDSSAADNSVRYRVTTAPVGGIPTSGTFGTVAVPAPSFNAASIAGADVTVTPSAATSNGIAFDSLAATSTGKIIDVTGSQFKYAVTGLTKVIDVESARKKFISGTVTSASADITVIASTASGSASLLATSGTIAVTLTGDFSWIDSSTATNATGIQTNNISFTNGTLGGVSATAISFVLAETGGTIGLANSLGLVIPTQSLALNLSQLYTGGSKSGNATGSGTGAYTLNGSTVTIYAVPTSSSVSNFMWMSNTGITSGDVSMTVYDAGETIDLGVVGTSEGGTNFDLSKALADGLAAAGETLSGGRVHIDVVTKVPSSDIAVSAAYRVGDDRVNLLTSLETDHD